MDDHLAAAAETLVHAGSRRASGEAVAPPLVPASIFVSSGEPDPVRAYGRTGNPGWEALEDALGAVEEAQALIFASGQAASMALMLALARHRDQVRAAPSVLWAETPTNPLLRVCDIARLAELAAEAGAPVVVDNTVATGLLQRPLELGATASLCSLTKAGSGHSDVILGAVTTRDPTLLEELHDWRTLGGGIPGPFECWLALRGMKTLTLRMARQCENALGIARHLARHPRVHAVHYPGIEEATLALARKQMPAGFGPLLSFEIDGSAAAADAVVAAARLIIPATSFGGVESTWERRARWPGETAPASLIRLSAGIEPLASIVADIDRAMKVI